MGLKPAAKGMSHDEHRISEAQAFGTVAESRRCSGRMKVDSGNWATPLTYMIAA
jgi:hypothetical protein